MVETSLLRHFIAVARFSGFTRAAEELHTSQSVVSRAVQRLEEEIGAPLFERTSRNVSLTPAGEAFLAEAVAITDRLAVAKNNARRIGLGEAARLVVGICPSTETDAPQVARGILAFRSAWPNLDLQLRATNSGVQPEALRAAEIDVGIMRLRRPDPDTLASEVIARTPLRVAIPAVWKLGRTRLRLEELADRPWIFPNPLVAPSIHGRLLEVCRTCGFEPKVAAVVEDVMAARILVACGLGAAFTHERLGDHREGYDVAELENVPGIFDAVTLATWPLSSSTLQIEDLVRHIIDARQPT